MKKIKVKVTSTDDLIFVNEQMMKHKDLNFDVHSGSINLDGKSLIGLLALSVQDFEIRISGNNHNDIKEFISEIEKYIV